MMVCSFAMYYCRAFQMFHGGVYQFQLLLRGAGQLLDDYNLFLRNGQGNQIKAIRTKLGLTQRQYADKLGVSLGNLKHWEQNRKQIFKSTWEKYFKQT